jgi:hypothetical protein
MTTISVLRSSAFEQAQVLGREHGGGRVVGRIDDQELGLRRDCRLHRLPVDAVVGVTQLHIDRHAAVDLDRRRVAVVGRFEQDHFVAGADQRGAGGVDAVGRTGDDGDFVLDVVVGAIQALRSFRRWLRAARDAGHRRVLVDAGIDVLVSSARSSGAQSKSGNPWDRLIALCSAASRDITVKMVVPTLGSLESMRPV